MTNPIIKSKSINVDIYKEFNEVISLCLPKMRDDKTFTLKDICPDQYWEARTKYERRKLGEYFYEMVVSETVDLKFVGKNGAKGNLYRLN